MKKILLLLAITNCIIFSSTAATTKTALGGDWTVASNWSPAGIPAVGGVDHARDGGGSGIAEAGAGPAAGQREGPCSGGRDVDPRRR